MHSMMDDPMVLESLLPYPMTLDKTVLVAQGKEIQEVPLPENGVHGHAVDAASGCMEVTERGGMEGASFDASQHTELDATSQHGDGAKSESAQNQGPTCPTKPDSKGSLVVEQQPEGSDKSNSPLKSPAGESDGGVKGTAVGQKKRKGRLKNWTDEETEILLKAVPQRKKIKIRLDKSSGGCEPSWEGIAKQVPGRTGDECRMRMDTLTKSYKAIQEYCDNQNKEFRQLNEEDFRDMKLTKRNWQPGLRRVGTIIFATIAHPDQIRK